MYSIWVHLLLGILVLNSSQARYLVAPANNNWGSDQRTPSSIMVDVTNNLGLLVLECHNINNLNNIAFSPYGLTSVLVALYEGVKGEGAVQVERVARFPYDLDVVRVGFRDIHRLLRSYFLPQEGFLAGLSLSNDNITFTSKYVSILRFYGYDVEISKNSSGSHPTTTTEQSNNDEPETEKNESGVIESNEEPTMTNTEENTEEIITEKTDDEEPVTNPPLLPTPAPTTPIAENPENPDSSDTEETPAEDTTETVEDVSPETVENVSPETVEDVSPEILENTNDESTESASVSAENSETTVLNEIDNFSTEESVITTKTNTETSISEDSATEVDDTTTTETTRKKRSLEDYLIARYYDKDDSANYGGYSFTPAPPTQAYPFLVNGITEQFNVNYTEYDAILPFAYIPSVRALALKFPLDSDKYYLLILLPLNPLGVNDLICDIRKYETIRKIIWYLKDTHVRAIVPSFMLKGFVFLTNTLQRLGLQNVFEPNRADFSAMTLENNIYVTNIEQAVTVTIRNYEDPKNNMKRRRYLNYRPMEFKATHPFIYFIMDSTLDVTLMAGKVINPINSRIQ